MRTRRVLRFRHDTRTRVYTLLRVLLDLLILVLVTIVPVDYTIYVYRSRMHLMQYVLCLIFIMQVIATIVVTAVQAPASTGMDLYRYYCCCCCRPFRVFASTPVFRCPTPDRNVGTIAVL